MINILFMGRKPVAAQALSWLIKQPCIKVAAVITDSHLPFSPTRNVAEDNGIPILNREEVERKIVSATLKIDLGLSVLYWQKIRAPILNACSRGVINFHPAPLPQFKGTAGYNLAILERFDQWAISAHYVDKDIDTGPLIEVSWFPVDVEYETVLSLEQKSQQELFTQFMRVCGNALASNKLLPTSPNLGGRYISRADMEAMKEIRPGDDVLRKIRAFWFPPYDGAWINIDGIRCTLVSHEILLSLAPPDICNLFTQTIADNSPGSRS